MIFFFFWIFSVLGLPVKYNEEILGVLLLSNKQKERGFTEADPQDLESILVLCAIALHNCNLSFSFLSSFYLCCNVF